MVPLIAWSLGCFGIRVLVKKRKRFGFFGTGEGQDSTAMPMFYIQYPCHVPAPNPASSSMKERGLRSITDVKAGEHDGCRNTPCLAGFQPW